MSFLDTILNIFFPARCIICGKDGPELCNNCLLEVPGALRESAEWVTPIFDYRHSTMKKAIWHLKYKGRRGLARTFAEVMYGRILEELSELVMMENFRNAILVPIPLSPRRLRERGFNQAQLICEELVKLDKSENFKLGGNFLIKPKETKHQAHIENRRERLNNIIGSFAIKNRNYFKDKNIILIDDVTTTGATLGEARKILKQAGAREIIAFTVAH